MSMMRMSDLGKGSDRGDRPPRDERGEGELPDRATIDDTIKVIHDHADRIFLWNYERERPQLVTLYNKAMGSQWNSVTDLDWSIDVDLEALVDTHNETMTMIRAAAEIPGSPIASWGEAEYTKLAIEFMRANLSQFMHGEQGAMMTAAKIVETVPWIDAKYYAATQTMDEARHTEVFAKYLDLKFDDGAYPMSTFLDGQITSLLEDSRWDFAYLGMQIVIESLALAAFGSMLRRTEEPLLKKLLRYVMSDEARHVAFGILSLSEYYQELSSAELKERQEFLLENTVRNRARTSTPEVWDTMGVEPRSLVPYVIEASEKLGIDPFLSFAQGFHAKLVPNVRKLGLLDANDGYLRKQWGEAGLLDHEYDDDTSADYDAYDAVAADRAAAATN